MDGRFFNGMCGWGMESLGLVDGIWVMLGGDVDGIWRNLVDGRVSMMVGDRRGSISRVDEIWMIAMGDKR